MIKQTFNIPCVGIYNHQNIFFLKKNPGGRQSSRRPTDAVATLSTSRFVMRKSSEAWLAAGDLLQKWYWHKNRPVLVEIHMLKLKARLSLLGTVVLWLIWSPGWMSTFGLICRRISPRSSHTSCRSRSSTSGTCSGSAPPASHCTGCSHGRSTSGRSCHCRLMSCCTAWN